MTTDGLPHSLTQHNTIAIIVIVIVNVQTTKEKAEIKMEKS